MWFVFPQASGLGHSEMARAYAINSTAEAKAYLDHPVLGPRLRESARALLGHTGISAQAVLGVTDAVKLRSSMTLFARISPDASPFQQVLDAFFGGAGDPATDSWLDAERRAGGQPGAPG